MNERTKLDLDQDYALREVGKLPVIVRNPSAREPSRPLKGLRERPDCLAYLRSLRKANSEKIGGGDYSPIVTHCLSE